MVEKSVQCFAKGVKLDYALSVISFWQQARKYIPGDDASRAMITWPKEHQLKVTPISVFAKTNIKSNLGTFYINVGRDLQVTKV